MNTKILKCRGTPKTTFIALCRALLRVAKGRSILDVGTGSGLLALFAAEAEAREVTGCEADENMFNIAHEVNENKSVLTVIP